MALFPHLPFDQTESHLSFAARLAAFHTGGALSTFLNNLHIKPEDYSRGQRKAVVALAMRADLDPAAIIANTPVSTGKAQYVLRGELISADFLSNPYTVCCPACLLEMDQAHPNPALARRGKFEWPLRVVRTCPDHEIALIQRPHVAMEGRFHELALRFPERGEALRQLVVGAVSRSVSPLQAYATARLTGTTGPVWLDSQTLEQAVWATEMLGAQLEFGDSKKVKELTPDDWDLAGRTGFHFTSRGEAGIREALYHRQDEFQKKTGRQPLRGNVFGRLFNSLASTKTAKDPGDIKRILREHLFDTVEMDEGANLLDGVLFKRRLHSVASLARESGHNPKTLRNVLIARGVIPREGSFHVFDVDLGRQIAASVQRVVHVTHLAAALNSSRPQATGLLDDRILPDRRWRGRCRGPHAKGC